MSRWIFAAGVLLAALSAGCEGDQTKQAANEPLTFDCKPGQTCWPTAHDWQQLRDQVGGRLIEVQSPLHACRQAAASPACRTAMQDLKNPFAISEHPGGTQSSGWLGAWEAAPSAYAVAAENAADVVAAVKFARQHNMRLVVKGTGHDYLGRSNAPDSLLVWTHRMRKVTVRDAFAGAGCPASQTAVPAVTVEAGTRWLEAYREVTHKHRRYVQGGGCVTVGAAGGFLQGGGFGSWSKKYGTAAGSLLEAEVVTADGRVLKANACQNPDLFWALRGGGGGTYGIVTQATLRTHELPDYWGFISGEITAKDDAAFKELLERLLVFYRESLFNERWGEQIGVHPDNSLELSMSFHGLRAKEAEAVWQPFLDLLRAQPQRFTVTARFIELPGDKMWDSDFIAQLAPAALVPDPRSGQPERQFWWKGDQEQVSAYWYAYQSRWIPADRFEPRHAKEFAAALFEASRHWSLGFHFNKGLAGAAARAIELSRETSMNPAVHEAAALVIAGMSAAQPNAQEGETYKARVAAAMKIIRDQTPAAGSYVNETDYFEPDWQRTFWGENYPKLLSIKRKYDPDHLFTCHHCVGSEQQ